MASGANRGAYYAGFLAPLMASDIRFDILAGVSAGGVAAAWFAAGDSDALLFSWEEAGQWKVSPHPWCSFRRFRTVDQLIRKITLNIMDVEAAWKGSAEIRLSLSELQGKRSLFPRLRQRVFTNRDAETEEEFRLMLRATAFVPWINGLRSSIEIRGRRYMDGGLTGRIPLDMIKPGEVDEIWISACSPNGRRELAEELKVAGDRPERMIIINPSRELPVSRWTMDFERISEAIEIGREDFESTLDEYDRSD